MQLSAVQQCTFFRQYLILDSYLLLSIIYFYSCHAIRDFYFACFVSAENKLQFSSTIVQQVNFGKVIKIMIKKIVTSGENYIRRVRQKMGVFHTLQYYHITSTNNIKTTKQMYLTNDVMLIVGNSGHVYIMLNSIKVY